MSEQKVRRRLGVLWPVMLAAAILVGYFGWRQYAKRIEYDLLETSAAGNVARVDELLKRGGKPDGRFGGDGDTPLHRAAAQGRDSVVKLLIAKRADPNIQNATGETPLIAAAYRGHADTVRLLLDAGANPNLAESRHRMTPLILAAWKGHASVARLLTERGADVRATTMDGKTARRKAEDEGHTDIVTILSEAERR